MFAEEALQRIREAGECFVIFDASTGEVLEVWKRDSASAPDGLIATMDSASQGRGWTKGRFMDASVTLDDLQREVDEARRAADRIAILSRWVTAAPDELIHILETDDFAVDSLHGPRIIVVRLFDYPPDVLGPLITRLEDIAQDKSDERRIDRGVRRLIESRLAVLAKDFARLKALWEPDFPGFAGLVWHPTLLACFGDLRPCAPEAIEILIRTVSSPDLLFGIRCEAMRSLGKVGAPAGARAALAIRATVYDSEPWIVELRERVLSRIETPVSAWQPCPRCYWGKVPGRPWQDHDNCATCLGLAFVPRRSQSPG